MTYLLFVILAAPLAHAQETEPTPPPPWRLSWEERMALRSSLPLVEMDPEVRPSGLPMADSKALYLDGVLQPEALVPWEVFMVLTAKAYSADDAYREEVRERILARSTDPELDRRDLWSRLAAAAAPYLALDEQRDRIMTEAVAAPDAAKAAIYAQLPSLHDYCEQRAVALDAARRVFGYEAFDRFLYEAVAPEVQMATTLSPAEVKAVEEGCADFTPGMP